MAQVTAAAPVSARRTRPEKPPSPARALGTNPQPLDALETHCRGGSRGQPGAQGLGGLLPLPQQHVGHEPDETLQSRAIAPVDLAQARLQTRPEEFLHVRYTAYPL